MMLYNSAVQLWQSIRPWMIVLAIACVPISCDETDLHRSDSFDPELVFENDAVANAAITAMYDEMFRTDAFASGSKASITALAGLSADEFTLYSAPILPALEFEKNSITTTNEHISSLWNTAYKSIYEANAVIAALSRSPLSKTTKDVLTGEALFIRAFCHFYLLNIFGDVPVITSTDYIINSHTTRQSAEQVYSQIKTDLLAAQPLLQEAYISEGRVRPNKFAATALLARVYLYTEDWANAEAAASTVIAAGNVYQLMADLNRVFLSSSAEAIWQLLPGPAGSPTNEGASFILVNAPQPGAYLLTNDLLGSFEESDNRALAWIGQSSSLDNVFHFPYKYKARQTSSGSMEYSMVLRLAEQYLIRSEARAHQNKLSDAIHDIDMIRARAGLSLIEANHPGISKDGLLLAIEAERRHELFAEWGHRWLDLKRADRAVATLSALKADLSANDLLYPLPADAFKLNPSLGEQNQGY